MNINQLEYIRLLEEENRRLKQKINNTSVAKEWLDFAKLKFSVKLILTGFGIGFVLFYLILPSPIGLLFPREIQTTLKSVQCGTNSVYQKLGI